MRIEIDKDNEMNDILACVFGFLEIKEWFNIKLVCRQWKEIGNKVFDPSRVGNPFKVHSIESVKFLLNDKRVDPSANDNWAIRWASENGHLEVVKLLLQDKRTDPSIAFHIASMKGHSDIIKFLKTWFL